MPSCSPQAAFFREFGNLSQYAVFQPGGKHIFELSDAQTAQVQGIYDRMFEEFHSEYIHKYDVLRNALPPFFWNCSKGSSPLKKTTRRYKCAVRPISRSN